MRGGGEVCGATPIRNKHEECLLQNYGNYHVPVKTNVKTSVDFEEPQTEKTGAERPSIETPSFSQDKASKFEPLQSERDQFLGDVLYNFPKTPSGLILVSNQ